VPQNPLFSTASWSFAARALCIASSALSWSSPILVGTGSTSLFLLRYQPISCGDKLGWIVVVGEVTDKAFEIIAPSFLLHSTTVAISIASSLEKSIFGFDDNSFWYHLCSISDSIHSTLKSSTSHSSAALAVRTSPFSIACWSFATRALWMANSNLSSFSPISALGAWLGLPLTQFISASDKPNSGVDMSFRWKRFFISFASKRAFTSFSRFEIISFSFSSSARVASILKSCSFAKEFWNHFCSSAESIHSTLGSSTSHSGTSLPVPQNPLFSTASWSFAARALCIASSALSWSSPILVGTGSTSLFLLRYQPISCGDRSGWNLFAAKRDVENAFEAAASRKWRKKECFILLAIGECVSQRPRIMFSHRGVVIVGS